MSGHVCQYAHRSGYLSLPTCEICGREREPRLVLANGEPFHTHHVMLTNTQVMMAQKLGLSTEEYAKAMACRECGSYVYHDPRCPLLTEQYKAVMSWQRVQ